MGVPGLAALGTDSKTKRSEKIWRRWAVAGDSSSPPFSAGDLLPCAAASSLRRAVTSSLRRAAAATESVRRTSGVRRPATPLFLLPFPADLLC
nr:hypothetical protein Itr_chr13CG09550 [Ipomoea trifida]GMC66435.1 hypothetical protein Iba_scaffold60790CG0010 [Ipomoea batatas]GMD97584.1 hypothetical protein Iba_chr15cCG3960 [Ipomoea batatas]